MLFSSLGVMVAVLTKNELVYAFTYSSVQDVYARDSQTPPKIPIRRTAPGAERATITDRSPTRAR
jgi:hypothetical protein